MSDPVHTMTPAQMQALMTPAMLAQMTTAQQEQFKQAADDHTQRLETTTARLPRDSQGFAFTRFTPCIVKQPPPGATIPPTLVNANVTVIRTAGERVMVRFPNGEEREFHRTELGVLQ